ncbi:MAG: ribbon-helix-helix domain-containing protein [Acidimicrobiia bacterium]
MIRTQVQLDEKQVKALRRIAADRGVSMAALVRESVDHLLESQRWGQDWDRAMEVVGKHRGSGERIAEEHDRYLEETFTA